MASNAENASIWWRHHVDNEVSFALPGKAMRWLNAKETWPSPSVRVTFLWIKPPTGNSPRKCAVAFWYHLFCIKPSAGNSLRKIDVGFWHHFQMKMATHPSSMTSFKVAKYQCVVFESYPGSSINSVHLNIVVWKFKPVNVCQTLKWNRWGIHRQWK